ncbi:hypothetical protein Tco_0496907 [Tanacetum coccineum]
MKESCWIEDMQEEIHKFERLQVYESPIPPTTSFSYCSTTVLPPPQVLPSSPLFDPQYFFLPEEILPPQKRARFLSPFSTDSSAPPQREQIRHVDEIVLACVRISTLEMVIEDIQVTMALLPPGFLEHLYLDMINAQDIERMIPPTPPRDIKPPVGSPISLSPSSSVGSSSPVSSPIQTTTSAAPAMTQAAMPRKLVVDSVAQLWKDKLLPWQILIIPIGIPDK